MVEQEQKIETGLVPGSKEDKPLTAADVRGKLQQALAFIREFPWLGLGVISTCFGGMVLYAYFRHIDYTPPDVAAVLGVSAAIAAVTVAYLGLALLSLAAPHWAYVSSDPFRSTDWRRCEGRLKDANTFLTGAQVLGVGLLFTYLGWRMWVDCVVGIAYVAVPAPLLLLAGGAMVMHASWGKANLTWPWLRDFAWLLFLSSLPVLFLLGWLVPSRGASEWHIVFWLIAWLALIVILGTLPERMPAWALLLIIPTLLPAVLWVGPMLNGNGYAFPKQVMELAGIRSTQAVELRVPSATCELVAAAAADGKVQAEGACPSGAGWGVVHAQVLSNLGARWWIEVRQVGSLELDPGKTLRMTIPAESVQIVRRAPANAKPANACKA